MVEHVRRRLVNLAVSENHVRDKAISDAARAVWEGPGVDGGLVSELWVEGAFPGEQSHDTLESLSHEGLFPGDLCQHVHQVFPADRRLYNHQSEALRKAATASPGEKPALVITAGTGLGKTEAFLLPTLADLWSAPERRKDGGMRCLILYPMNALVADQVSRIYSWLQGQRRLTVFHFTSETPEDARSANKRGDPEW
ncbi:MAG: DEAD/DEAH box helicase, partial [Candidatus Hydrogenedentes bacterium]|nr:DEAD/DEAH box helicase [Candidatus Hydrogenedentota bacterium]